MANSITLIEEIKKLPLHQQVHVYTYLEEICIATAIDRHGNLIMELLCKGNDT